MIDLVRKGERVFAVCGSSHAVKLEPALRATLGSQRNLAASMTTCLFLLLLDPLVDVAVAGIGPGGDRFMFLIDPDADYQTLSVPVNRPARREPHRNSP